jgi:hypothetical protein
MDAMTKYFNVTILNVFFILLLSACNVQPTIPDTPESKMPAQINTVTVTSSPSPSPTPHSTSIPSVVPPTAFPLPTSSANLEREPDLTVCAAGCDYVSIQIAINHASREALAIIEIRDPIHTEAGIVIDRNVVLRGLGMGETVLQSHQSLDESPDRVILVQKDLNVTIQGMTIQHGDPAIENDKGGGIRNFGNLIIEDCLITGNQANGGGGISNTGDLAVINSVVNDNLADGVASPGHECGNGGGIHSGSGTLFILNSTISGNQGGYKGRARGGGVFVGCSSEAVIINTTISKNRASRTGGRDYGGGDSLGGGIYSVGNLQLIHVTITENRASGGGAGIFVGKHLDYINTIIAGNSGKGNCYLIDPLPEGIIEPIGTNFYNLVTGGRCGAVYQDDPLLGNLTDLGGSMEVHPLLSGSPAIDLVPAEFCLLEFDQLGNKRIGMSESKDSFCDLGAVEYQP